MPLGGFSKGEKRELNIPQFVMRGKGVGNLWLKSSLGNQLSLWERSFLHVERPVGGWFLCIVDGKRQDIKGMGKVTGAVGVVK